MKCDSVYCSALRNQAIGKLHNYKLCRSLKRSLLFHLFGLQLFALVLAFSDIVVLFFALFFSFLSLVAWKYTLLLYLKVDPVT